MKKKNKKESYRILLENENVCKMTENENIWIGRQQNVVKNWKECN